MATSSRTKKKVLVNIQLDQAQEASESYATNSNKLKKLEAKMNEEINKVKSKYQDDITALQESLTEPVEVLQVYAKEQQADWGKKKSMELLHCIIGFRTGMPKVVKDKKFTWEGINDIVAKVFPNLVRTKIELDKDAVIALSKADGFDEIRTKCFIDVTQEETFYVDPKVEELAVA